MNSTSTRTLSTLIILLAVADRVAAEDWPQWLGPNRDAVWQASDIIETFPNDGPKLRWTKPIGGGYAGPAVADGRVFVFDRIVTPDKPAPVPSEDGVFKRTALPGEERLLCLRESDGETLWEVRYECLYTNAKNYAIGPRAAPIIDGNRVYTLGAEGDLRCHGVSDGKFLWHRNFPKEYGQKTPVWGFAAHPLVDGDQLICLVGGKGSGVVALEKRSGKELWRALDCKEPGYSSPAICRIGGQPVLLAWTAEEIAGLDPKTGKVYWSVDLKPRHGMAISTPIPHNDLLYLTATFGLGMTIELGPTPTDAKVLWRKDTRFEADGAISTPMYHDGHMFGDSRKGTFYCVEPKSGDTVWSTTDTTTGGRPAIYSTTFIVRHLDPKTPDAEPRFFIANDLGELIIARLSKEGYDEISRAKLLKPTHTVFGRLLVWSHPAYANQSIFCRNDEEIVCYSLKKGE